MIKVSKRERMKEENGKEMQSEALVLMMVQRRQVEAWLLKSFSSDERKQERREEKEKERKREREREKKYDA